MKRARKRDAGEIFDAGYYGRYYESAETRVYGREQVASLAHGILGLLTWWGQDVRTVLDVGAGAGHMREAFKKERPRATYLSTEASAYACKKYGHEKLDISRQRLPFRFDLVVCHGVLPYLDNAECARAIDNLAAMCGGFLYLEAITKRDLKEVCDVSKTDVAVYGRPLAFYESRLQKELRKVGAGLYYTRTGPLTFYELEAAER